MTQQRDRESLLSTLKCHFRDQKHAHSSDLLLDIFWAGLKGPKRSSIFVPFPPFLIENGHPNFARAEQIFKSIPSISEFFQQPDLLDNLSVESLQLLCYIVTPPDIQVEMTDSASYHLHLKQYQFVGGPSLLTSASTNYKIASIRYKGPRLRPGTTSSDKSLYAFHGSPLSNWWSILNRGLHVGYGKGESLFGRGIYFSIDQLVAENFLEFQIVDRPGKKPKKLACIAGCKIIDEPSQSNQTSNTKSYLVVEGDENVTIEHLLVYEVFKHHHQRNQWQDEKMMT
ncbi:hypothetical protein PROFUN_01842 [Planoprotostelium fungivorum]|uniref:PARP n=1 Tax=Planoprotostelium fungivorum TaxID=1890364 RepID=A0A2P6NYV5_9EUKA|nr:hypothetical protein PROFUN_01842 [Planoprotostelium fungivorum]